MLLKDGRNSWMVCILQMLTMSLCYFVPIALVKIEGMLVYVYLLPCAVYMFRDAPYFSGGYDL